MNDVLNFIGNLYPVSKDIYDALGLILSIIVIHRTVYFFLGIFFTRKFKPARKKHKYAIVIAARNEEKVIGNLLDSIKKQDYPKSKIKVFVVADNCTDNTSKIVREHGCICYERFDKVHQTKGYALEFLFDQIEKDYGRDKFEGYFVFDSDNLLKSDYISKMNDAFDSGEKIITSYRNTKNFDENWLSSTYALHWLRSVRTNHRARSVLRLATNIQGTGFLFSSEIVKNGWHYTSLTEDRALTADAVAQGYRISYQDDAQFYDEQPTDLKIAIRQRLRWSKGHLLAFVETGPYLFVNVIFGKRFLKTDWSDKKKKKEKKNGIKEHFVSLLESIRHRFASFDTLIQLTPISFINLCRWMIVSLFIFSCYSYTNGITNFSIFGGNFFLAKLLREYFKIEINMESGVSAFFISLLVVIWLRIFYRIYKYFRNIFIAVYLFIIERSRIKKMSFWKKVLYCFTWPIFDIIGRHTTYAALFMKVTWKPIPHNSKVTIDDLNNNNN